MCFRKDFVQNCGDNAAVSNAGVALVAVGDAVFAADFVLAVVVEVKLQAERVLQAANKAVMGVGLPVFQGETLQVRVQGEGLYPFRADI